MKLITVPKETLDVMGVNIESDDEEEAPKIKKPKKKTLSVK